MIASISGRLASKAADRVVIETSGGVGYEITVPLGVMEKLPPVGERVTLATELVVREDAQLLFGFLSESEKRFFQRLLGVSGIGPRTALALISTLGVDRGTRAIKGRDIAALASVSGIGHSPSTNTGSGHSMGSTPLVASTSTPVVVDAPSSGAASSLPPPLEQLAPVTTSVATATANHRLRPWFPMPRKLVAIGR